MTKESAKKHARRVGRGLGSAAMFTVTALAAAGEEQERQRKIQEHVDAIRALDPNLQVTVARQF